MMCLRSSSIIVLSTLISAFYDVDASAEEDSLALKPNEIILQRNSQDVIDINHHRRDQSPCSAPSAGCGYGLWNEDSCECNCIPSYCFNDIYQSCISPGSCPNAFEGCTPHVNCPYYPNPMTGKCESGSTISPGLFTIFRTLEECCRTNYPSDPSACLQEPPTATPSTGSPSVATPVKSESIPLSQMTEAPTSNVVVSPPLDTVGIYLTPIQIQFHNLPSNFELNDDRRGEMEEIIRNRLTTTNDDLNLNVTILSLDIVENIFSGRYLSERLPLELEIEITGARIIPGDVYDAYLKTLQDQLYSIERALRQTWGPEVYSDSVVLSIEDAQTTLAPTSKPTTSRNGVTVVPTPPNDDGGQMSVPIWAVILLSILLTMLCGGLLVWQRRRDKDMDIQAPSHDSYFDEEMSNTSSSVISKNDGFNRKPRQSKGNQGFNESRRSQMSFNRSRQSPTDVGFNNSRRSRMSFNQSRQSQTDGGFNNSRRSRMSSNQSRHSQIEVGFNNSRRSRMSHVDKDFNQSHQSQANRGHEDEMSTASLSIDQRRGMDPSSRNLNYNHQMDPSGMDLNFDQSHQSQMRSNQQVDQINNDWNERRPGRVQTDEDLNFNQSHQSQMRSNQQVDPSSRNLNYNHQMDPSGMDLNLDQSHQSQMRLNQQVNQSNNNWNERRPDGVQTDQNVFNEGHQTHHFAEEPRIKESVQFENVKERMQHENVEGSVLDDGYDGGKSSFFISNGHITEASSESDNDADGSSSDEGNVLGLLYYDGASSAGESDGRTSGKSRRSRRTNRSGRTGKSSKNSSGKSGKSSGKSSKTKSSQSGKSRRRKSRPLKNEGTRIDGTDAYKGRPNYAHEHSGSIVFANPGQLGTLDEDSRAEQSAFSHGSTIRTEDNHHKSFPSSDEYGLSFNSVGECTTGLSNQPEVKF